MVTTKADEKKLFQRLASLNGWGIATHFNCEYDGDSNPINHGGFFYDLRTWDTDGEVNVVEFWECPETKRLIVQRGTITKPKTEADWESCWSCVGVDESERHLPRAQVYAVRAAMGITPEDIFYPSVKHFDLKTWAEWRIWRNVADWLTELGE